MIQQDFGENCSLRIYCDLDSYWPSDSLSRRTVVPPTLDTMTTALQDPRVATALDRMYSESRQQMALLLERRDELERLSSASAQERADAMSDLYIPVTPEAGRLL